MMGHLFPLLLLLSVHSRVRSQIAMVESGGGVLQPSQSMELVCTVSGASISASSFGAAYWVQQPQNKPLLWIGGIWYDGVTRYSPSYKSRSTITRDIARGIVRLQLRQVTEKDSGKIHCVRGAYWNFDAWGPGATLIVTLVPATKPQVFTLANCCGGPSAEGQFGILAKGYLPPVLSYSWKNGSSSITAGIRTSPDTFSTTSGLYFSSSVIALSRSSLETSSVSCTVEHSATSTSVTKTLQVAGLCKPRAPPAVKMMQTSCPERDGSGFVGIACVGSSFSSKDYTVMFREDNRPVSLSPTTSSVSQALDGTYMVSVYTRISQAKWNGGTRFSCAITDTNTRQMASDSLSRCVDNSNVLGITISLVAPTAEDLYLSKKARVSCTAGNLPDSSGATFAWFREKPNGPVEPVKQDPEQQENGVYSQTSHLPICVDEWEQGEKFTCRVSHPQLANSITKTISKDLGIQATRPRVYVHGPTTEEVSRNEMVTVTCLAKQFLPDQITIKWNQDGTEADRASYDTTPPQLMKATNDYMCVSVLQITAEAWNAGAVATCVVVHEAAAHNVIQQSVDRLSGKPSAINMSINLMDSTSTLTCM